MEPHTYTLDTHFNYSPVQRIDLNHITSCFWIPSFVLTVVSVGTLTLQEFFSVLKTLLELIELSYLTISRLRVTRPSVMILKPKTQQNKTTTKVKKKKTFLSRYNVQLSIPLCSQFEIRQRGTTKIPFLK